ncbi:MAG: cupin domain-containing protein [Gammaproteobacteria bacterium]
MFSNASAVGLDDLNWTPPGGGNGFPVGVQTARQGVDPDTGGITYYAKFPAGSHFDLHWHTHDEYVVVVQGELSIRLGEDDHDLAVGSYVVIPGSLNHSWTVPADGEDAIILVRRAGPADFHFVEQ